MVPPPLLAGAAKVTVAWALLAVAIPIVGAEGATIMTKLAITVQSPVMAAVVKVVPTRVPPQEPLIETTYPLFGVTVNIGVAPLPAETGVDGSMVPLAGLATDGVMVRRPAMVRIWPRCPAAL